MEVCRLLFLACMVFFGVNLLSEKLLRMDDSGREASPSFAGLRAQPSAELFRGEYELRANGSEVVLSGRARMTLGSQQTTVLAVQISSISLLLVGAEGHLKSLTESGKRGRGGGDVELVLRGVELMGPGRVTASGLADGSPLLGNLRHWRQPTAAGGGASEEELGEEVGDPGSRGSGGTGPCRLDAVLQSQGELPDVGVVATPVPTSQAEGSHPVHTAGFVGDIESLDCGFSLHFTAEAINVQHIGRKVTHYALWVILLTVIQMRCFISQMRYTEEGPSAAKLSIIGIAAQALMDAYDSFLHLSLTASSQYMFNTFAMISLFKFVLFALLEVRYLLTIWRSRHREVFAAGWDEVRRHLSRVYSYFYGALIGGLLIIFNSLEYLDVIALFFQAYWVPQILHDARQGSKASLQPRFLVGISVTRCLAILYLWGCPEGVFSGDLYPSLPRAPNPRLCLAAIVLQVVQVSMIFSQQALGPRWFVPWMCLPHVYNYRRATPEVPPHGSDDCVICMGELGADPEARRQNVVTPCDHRFHGLCLERWMDVKMECPTCRASLPPMG